MEKESQLPENGYMFMDHCRALYKIYKKGESGETYNIGSNTKI